MLWICLSAAYALLMSAWWLGWRRHRIFEPEPSSPPAHFISVIVPARNEAAHIEHCLNHLLAQRYPDSLREIIVIDDHSDDDTAARVIRLSVSHPELQLIRRTGQDQTGKKAALMAGIERAKGSLVVTTDADCEAPPNWLYCIEAVFRQYSSVQMVTAPVVIHRENNLLQRFQSLDLMGMMGITGAGAFSGKMFMANGANLAFRKKAFQAVGGYAGNEQIASGDDMFLVQKIARRFPGGVYFLKQTDAVVKTLAPNDWSAFIQQRIRWGGKNAALPGWGIRLALLSVFVFCWSIIISGVMAAFQMPGMWRILAIQALVKFLFDTLLLREMALFFNRKDLLRWLLPAFVLHTLYIALIGFASLFFRKYQWKGRTLE